MQRYEARLLYLPADPALRFLPEGPHALADGRISWVAIQHGPQATSGSLNLLDPSRCENQCFPLTGRPGFAFPTQRQATFVIGLERRIVLLDPLAGSLETLCEGIDEGVSDTIINDGLAFDEGLLFGTKDLRFQEAKAGLYLWRRADRRLIRLRDDQICSNGKVLTERDGQRYLLDIDTPTRTIVAYALDVAAGTLGPPSVVVDLRQDEAFPDGMVVCPDGRSVIVAMYDPRDVPHGQARQYAIGSGELEAIWTIPGSPQVTCPLLVELQGRVQLVLTTAVEHMPAERQARFPQAGGLYVAETPFEQLGAARPTLWPL